MRGEKMRHMLNTLLFPDLPDNRRVYIVFDALQATIQDLEWKNSLYDSPAYILLGSLQENTSAAWHDHVPYLAEVRPYSPLQAFCLEHVGKSLGIFVKSGLDIEKIASILLNLRHVVMPSGGSAQFRYYDPRVFNCFLQHASHEQSALFFPSGEETYYVEDIINDTVNEYSIHAEDEFHKYQHKRLRISAELKESFDERQFSMLLFKAYQLGFDEFSTRAYADMESEIRLIADWAYEHGMTDDLSVTEFTAHALRHGWLPAERPFEIASGQFDSRHEVLQFSMRQVTELSGGSHE